MKKWLKENKDEILYYVCLVISISASLVYAIVKMRGI